VIPTKIVELIEVPLGMWKQIGQRNHVLSGGSDAPKGASDFGGIFEPIVKYRECLA